MSYKTLSTTAMMPCNGDSEVTNRHDVEAEINADLTALAKEYKDWNKAQGLSLGSAGDHLFDATLTAEQRVWLSDFSQRWEGASPVLTSGSVARHRDL